MKTLLKTVRRIVCKTPESVWYRGNLPLLDGETINRWLTDRISEGAPLMVTRLGSVEIKPLLYYSLLSHKSDLEKLRLYIKGDIDYIFDSNEYQKYMSAIMCNNAGFFPQDNSLLASFSSLMSEDIRQTDLLGCWLNEYLLRDTFKKDICFCSLGDLEPYDYIKPWTLALKGKKVLVIHPFAKSIESQYARRELLWKNADMLPEFELKTIKAVQSIAGAEVPYRDWFEALDYMKSQIDCVDFDIALVGCGAYGLPLAAYIRRKGLQAVHLGGPLQILFGIKGKRWDNIPSVSCFYNDNWVRPQQDECPVSLNKVENGCYW